MENIQNLNSNENKIIFQNIRKDCPYCHMKISIEEFEDHILCHELKKNNNKNYSNIINGQKNNNNQLQNENSQKGLDKFKQKIGGIFDSFKTNISNVIDKIDKFDSDNDSDDNNMSYHNINNNDNILSQNNNNNSSFNNNKANPLISKVSNFFKTITKSNSEDSGSGSDDGPNLNIRFPFFRIRRRNSDSDNIFQNYIDNNNENLSLDDIPFLDDDFHKDLSKKDDYKEILKYIPTSTVKGIIKSSDNNKCVICLSDFQVGEKISTLPCLHIYHSNCI